jgi:5-formyltetrahydrofolate cyclo-ligase
MEEIQATKSEIRDDIAKRLSELSDSKLAEKTKEIEARLFGFANFLEAKIALLYTHNQSEVETDEIIRKCFDYRKIVVLPAFNTETHDIKLLKVDDPDTDMIPGPRGIKEPDPARCKVVPIDRIDIAIIPGIALDEKGGRIGSGKGYYDRLIPKLSITTRKVALALECQIIQQVPMESHDKHVDIVITEKRIIYKI